MFILESFAYAIQVAYCVRRQFQFSTYGESVAMLVQNVVIVLLIFRFTTGFLNASFVSMLAAFVAAEVFCFLLCPLVLLQTLQGGTVLIFIVSKVPQIWSNWTNGSTGNLDGLMFMLQTGGSLARVFTTLKEVDDIVYLSGFIIGALLNGTIFLQILVLGNKGVAAPKKKVGKSKSKKL